MDKIDHDSPAVQSSLTILEDVITRMAANSANAKTWCIALVSAILVLLADRDSADLFWIAIGPIVLFCMLDAYYLAMEKGFRDRYNQLVKRLHAGATVVDDLFVVIPAGQSPLSVANAWRALRSFSVWPFYTIQVVVLVVVRFLLSQGPPA
jgi:hypothetical protein